MDMVECILNEWVHHQSCRPDAHADPHFSVLLRGEGKASAVSLWIGRAWKAWSKFCDMVLRLDSDAVAVEKIHRIIGERCVEHGQDLWRNIIDRDFDMGDQRRIHFSNLIVAEIEKLSCELNSGS